MHLGNVGEAFSQVLHHKTGLCRSWIFCCNILHICICQIIVRSICLKHVFPARGTRDIVRGRCFSFYHVAGYLLVEHLCMLLIRTCCFMQIYLTSWRKYWEKVKTKFCINTWFSNLGKSGIALESLHNLLTHLPAYLFSIQLNLKHKTPSYFVCMSRTRAHRQWW